MDTPTAQFDADIRLLVTQEFLRCVDAEAVAFEFPRCADVDCLKAKAIEVCENTYDLVKLIILLRAVETYRLDNGRKAQHQQATFEYESVKAGLPASAGHPKYNEYAYRADSYSEDGINRLKTFIQMAFHSECGRDKPSLALWKPVSKLLYRLGIDSQFNPSASLDPTDGEAVARLYYDRLRKRWKHLQNPNRKTSYPRLYDVVRRHPYTPAEIMKISQHVYSMIPL